MFTPNSIQDALEGLFDLCGTNEIKYMKENYSEEFEDIDPELLAIAFQRDAAVVSKYHVLSSAGDGIDYHGATLLENRAVKLLSYALDRTGDDRVYTVQKKELWLEEDMTFSVVSCVATYMMDQDALICMTEHRSFVTNIEFDFEIFFDIGDLVCELDDICMLELLAMADATVCEP